MQKQMEVKSVSLTKVDADPEQPRRVFNIEKLATLKRSIQRHGVMSPLVVEERPDGRFFLIDGERRYRASKDLSITSVPVIVRPSQDETERLLQQFNLQEQHEGWTAPEKAMATVRLSEKLKMPVSKLAEELGIGSKTVSEYKAFANLLERKEYQKQEIAIDFAASIVRTRDLTKKLWLKVLGEEFTEDMQRDLERAIFARIKSGEIKRRADLAKIADMIRMEPKSVLKLCKGKFSIDRLFLETNAETASAYRLGKQAALTVTTYFAKGVATGDSFRKLFSESDKRMLAKSADTITSLLATL